MIQKSINALPYRPIITHDVDRYYKWKNFKSILGEYSRIFRGQSTWSYFEALNSFMGRQQNDPFSNLIEIAELDRTAGLQSVFYIMTTEEKHPKNINDYSVKSKEIKDTLLQLIAMGCEIGIHPGIYSFNDPDRIKEQKEKLEDIIGQEVVRSRQHYLKYDYPSTFKYLESSGIKNDSSILVNLSKVQEKEKRSTYPMFDNDSQSITQTPLVFMDTHYMQLKSDALLKILEDSIAPAKKSGGEIMILWHNNNISNSYEVGLYKEALKIISSRESTDFKTDIKYVT